TGLDLEGTVPVDTQAQFFSLSNVFSTTNVFIVGTSTGAAIRLKGSNGIVTHGPVTAAMDGEVQRILFSTPFTDPGRDQLDQDCLVALGSLGSEYKRLLVYGITPKPDMTADISFVDEAPELFAGQTTSFIVQQDGSTLLFEDLSGSLEL